MAEDLVDRAVRERDDIEISVWSRLNVRADAEAGAKQQTLTFGDVELGEVIGDAILQPWIINRDRASLAILSMPPIAKSLSVHIRYRTLWVADRAPECASVIP